MHAGGKRTSNQVAASNRKARIEAECIISENDIVPERGIDQGQAPWTEKEI